MRILVVDPLNKLTGDIPGFLESSGWTVDQKADYAWAASEAITSPPDAMLVSEPCVKDGKDLMRNWRRLIQCVEEMQVATIILSGGPAPMDESPFVEVAQLGITPEEIRGRLATIMRYHETIRQMERELNCMRKLGKRLNEHFQEVEQELQLAGRLQRDFLPSIAEPICNLKFATLYRPASEVSGDTYDVYRVDEDHVAFYLADAVGHGVAAGLLTMFIRKAVLSKRILDEDYEILEAAETMAGLNEALANQMLANCRFVTAVYCIFNTKTLELTCSRGGHPYPFLVNEDGGIREIKPSGGLLGLFPDETFESETVTLKPGQKIILFTDGLETAFGHECSSDKVEWLDYYREALRELAPLPVNEIVEQLGQMIDQSGGSLNPDDDITVVAAEVT